MDKKILILGVLVVLMLVTISFASAVTTNTQNTRKESPLYNIRTKLAIGERIQNLKETIKAKFVGERLFFLPLQWLINKNDFSVRQPGYLVSCQGGVTMCTKGGTNGCSVPPN
jgi:hypothetical protein